MNNKYQLTCKLSGVYYFLSFFLMATICFSCGDSEKKMPIKEEAATTVTPQAKGVVVQPGEGEKLIFRAPPVPDSITIIIDPETGSNRYSMGTQNLPVDYLVPMHKHETEDEILFFHKGHGHASVGDETVEVEPGTTVFIPHGVWHSIHNTSDEPAQMVWFVAKPGLEDFFREGSVAPGEPWTPLTPAEVAAIGKKHGVIFAPSEEEE